MRVSRAWILFIALIAVLTIALFGCVPVAVNTLPTPTEKDPVYKITRAGVLVVYRFQGHDYVLNLNGGVMHSLSCPGDHGE